MTDCLSIERLGNIYLVPHGHPAPEKLRSELDELARHRLSECCARSFSEVMDHGDESVWVIDSLDVDFLMDVTAAPPQDLATFWAAQIRRSLLRTFSAGPDGNHVLRFANRAEYLATFLHDLALGRAWEHWYYRQFDSLRSLPAGAAMRQALVREAENAEAALIHLHRARRLNEVAGRWTAFDQRVLLQLCSPQESQPTGECFAALLEAWADRGRRGNASHVELYAHVRSSHPEFSPAEVRTGIVHLEAIAKWIERAQLGPIVAALRSGRVPEVIKLLPAQEQESLLFVYSLSAVEPIWMERLEALAGTGESGSEPEELAGTAADGVSHFASPLGGLFLLLAVVIEDREFLRSYGRGEGGLLRYLLLLACCGFQPGDVSCDPALLLAAGLDEAPAPSAFQQTPLPPALHQDDCEIGQLDLSIFETHLSDFGLDDNLRIRITQSAALLMKKLGRRAPGLAASSAGFLWRNVLSGDARFTVAPGKILAELSPRPLEIVMRMAGFHDLAFNLPWSETEVQIRFENRQER